MMKKVYIAGPITNNPGYELKFLSAELGLTLEGYDAINPAKNKGESYRELVNKGLEQLMGCDIIYMLKGYKESRGAMLELTYAQTVGLGIMYED